MIMQRLDSSQSDFSLCLDRLTAWQEAAHLLLAERKRLAYLEAATQQLRLMLGENQHWSAVAAIADHLSAHLTLDEDMLAEIAS